MKTTYTIRELQALEAIIYGLHQCDKHEFKPFKFAVTLHGQLAFCTALPYEEGRITYSVYNLYGDKTPMPISSREIFPPEPIIKTFFGKIPFDRSSFNETFRLLLSDPKEVLLRCARDKMLALVNKETLTPCPQLLYNVRFTGTNTMLDFIPLSEDDPIHLLSLIYE